jgi:predicted ABC-type ATPase
MKTKKVLYLIAGANGSGKTTLAHELLKDDPALVFMNSDEIAVQISDKIGVQAGKIMLQKLAETFQSGKSFALESTISGFHHLRILEMAKKAKYEVDLIYVFLDFPEANIARIKKRVQLGGHDVPDDVVVRRFHKSINNFWAASRLANRWKLYYNGGYVFELVAEDDKIMNFELYEKFKRGLK